MSKVIEIAKRFNHRWKTDPAFERGFDYDNPKYAGVDVDLKWAIPLIESQKRPAFIQNATLLKAQADQRIEAKNKAIRRSRLRIV
jgi:hypothetical protein